MDFTSSLKKIQGNYMKKFTCLFIVLMLLFSYIPALATTEETVADSDAEIPDASVTDGCNTIEAQRGILGERQLVTNCTAAFLYEYNTDTLMYSFNGDMRIVPASLVKIMTAMIAIDQGNLEDEVIVSTGSFSSLPHDAAMIRDVPMVDGEILTLEDLLNLMMLVGGNDAAIVIAEHIAGSQAAFIEEMNRYAAELGCKETNFTNVHGMYDANQYSTCRDLTRILDKAMEYEEFRKIFGAIYYTVPATNKNDKIRSLTTNNFHLTSDANETYYDGRVTGGRTGVGLNDERCIASTASKEGLDMICIIIGAQTVYDEYGYDVYSMGGYKEVSALLDYGYDGFKAVQILHEGQILKQLDIENGECDLTVASKEAVFTIIPKDIYLEDLNFVFSDTALAHSAPIEKGEYVSSVRIMYGNLCLAETELYAMNSVRTLQDSYSIKPSNPTSNWLVTVLIVFILIVMVVGLVFFAWPRIRYMYRIRKRNQRRRQMQGRRSQ